MPSWKPVLVITVISGLAIAVIFPDYLSLQTATLVEDFRGALGDSDARASAAAIMDMVFSVSYATLGVVAYRAVTAGVPLLIGTLASIGAGLADEVENVMVLLNIRAGTDLKQSGVDAMLTAGSVKWGLVVTAIVLLLALAGQRWLEDRRG